MYVGAGAAGSTREGSPPPAPPAGRCGGGRGIPRREPRPRPCWSVAVVAAHRWRCRCRGGIWVGGGGAVEAEAEVALASRRRRPVAIAAGAGLVLCSAFERSASSRPASRAPRTPAPRWSRSANALLTAQYAALHVATDPGAQSVRRSICESSQASGGPGDPRITSGVSIGSSSPSSPPSGNSSAVATNARLSVIRIRSGV
jgi:hypothetical protein